MSAPLDEYRRIWECKPALRTVYEDFYRRIADACLPGLTLEIGGGIGNLKQIMPDVVATDIQFAPWLDCIADAQRLPFATGTATNIVMVDVLHHVEFPSTFFREAERVLKPGGRIVMIEPAITWGSTLFYRLFHQEPIRVSVDPLVEGCADPTRDPDEFNQAIPMLVATRDRNRLRGLFPNLEIARVDWFSLVVYPLSGGFKPWSLIADHVARHMLKIERLIEPTIGRFVAFRMMLVVQKAL